jgi:fructose-bisphosphate aldolase class II
MALVDMRDMLYHAYRNGYAVGAFDLPGLEFLEGVMAAAERCSSPVILSVAESRPGHPGFGLIMPAVEAAARRSPVPVAIHLSHGASLASAVRAINLGCNGVMLDASREPLSGNIRHTRAVVDMAHACGVPVEGKLGRMEGGDTAHTTGGAVPVKVEEAGEYVERTGVDFLAVSIGTAHGHTKGEPDCQWLERIGETLEIPLAIDDGTGLDDERARRLIARGVAKIGVPPTMVQARPRNGAEHADDYAGLARSVGAEAERRMREWGSLGRAPEVLARCTPWTPVEHVIIYNVTGMDEQDVDTMMAEGRRVLGAIPGVREVITGRAVKEDAKYRYAWLVRFCHPKVIDSYREHPAHVEFADTRFRPVAGERISIDYRAIDRKPPAQ